MEWISVKDRLPERRWPTEPECFDSVEVLFIDGDGDMWTGWHEPDEGEWFGKGATAGGYVSGVTHWMPLPQPPQPGGNFNHERK